VQAIEERAMSYADVRKRPQRWLIPSWLAMEVVTIGAGAGGIAKGRVACDLIASVTTGAPFCGGAIDNDYGPQEVIAWTPEDRPDTAMAWRLDAAGADRERVHDFTYKSDGTRRLLDEAACSAIEAKVDALRRQKRRVGLVYIDPLMAVLPPGRNISTNANARAYVVDLLDDLAQAKELAILVNHHTVKDGSIGGSSGLVQAARLVLLYKRGKRGICTLSVHKSNIGPDCESVNEDGDPVLPPLQYRLTGADDRDMRIEWTGRPGQETEPEVAQPAPPVQIRDFTAGLRRMGVSVFR
jgi:AAA domain-containing protein